MNQLKNFNVSIIPYLLQKDSIAYCNTCVHI